MKNRKQRMIAFLVALSTLIMLWVPTPEKVYAENDADQIQTEIDRLEEEKDRIDQEIGGLKAQYNANMSEIERIVEEKNVLDQQISLLYDKMDNINEQIYVFSKMIAEKQIALEDAQTRLDTLMLQHKERIRAMEENGRLTYWEVIFQANSFSDFLDRLNMIEEIDRADQQRLDEIRQVAEELKITRF